MVVSVENMEEGLSSSASFMPLNTQCHCSLNHAIDGDGSEHRGFDQSRLRRVSHSGIVVADNFRAQDITEHISQTNTNADKRISEIWDERGPI